MDVSGSTLQVALFTLEEIVEIVVRRARGTVSLRSVDHLHLQEFLATRIVVRRGIRVVDSVSLIEIFGIQRLGGDFVQAVI